MIFNQNLELGVFALIPGNELQNHRISSLSLGNAPLNSSYNLCRVGDLLGVGAVIGSFVGGLIAGRDRRLEWLAAISLTGGAVTGLFFVLEVSTWILVAVAFVASVLVSVSMPVLTTLIMHIAGQSRGTAGGMFTASAQAGGVIGSSAGGLMLSLGSYPAVGVLFLVASVLSASVVGLIIRRSLAFKLRGSDT